MKKKPYNKMLGLWLVISLFVLIGIPLLINESYKSGGYKTLWGAEHVLGYYGSILSGLATFGAVFLTIKYNNEARKEDEARRLRDREEDEARRLKDIKEDEERRLAYEFRPYFVIEEVRLWIEGLDEYILKKNNTVPRDDFDEYGLLYVKHIDDKWSGYIPKKYLHEDQSIVLYIYLKNIGTGPAIDIIPMDGDVKSVRHIEQVIDKNQIEDIEISIGNCQQLEWISYDVEYENINGCRYKQQISFFIGDSSTGRTIHLEHIGKQVMLGTSY